MPLRWLAVVAYAAVIFFFSSRTPKGLPKIEIPHIDKVVHASEYAGLGFLLCRALRRREAPTTVDVAVAIVLGTAYGVSDEYHQTFVPGRSGNDLGDLAADAIGSSLGALLYARLIKRANVPPTHSTNRTERR